MLLLQESRAPQVGLHKVSKVANQEGTSKPNGGPAQLIYMGDGNKIAVEAIGVHKLRLDSDFVLDLDETLYVTSFRWNLIFILLLDRSDFTVTLGNEMVSLFFKSKIVGTRILIDGYIN